MTKSTYKDHLSKLRHVLAQLQDANLRANSKKSSLTQEEIKYLGYLLTKNDITPIPEKISDMLANEAPKNVKELRQFIGIVQYHQDIWEKRSHVLVPLTDLVGECGHTKTSKQKYTKKKPCYWDNSHQEAFDTIKQVMTCEAMLSYRDFSKVFEVHTYASSGQLSAIIVQNGRLIGYTVLLTPPH